MCVILYIRFQRFKKERIKVQKVKSSSTSKLLKLSRKYLQIEGRGLEIGLEIQKPRIRLDGLERDIGNFDISKQPQLKKLAII